MKNRLMMLFINCIYLLPFVMVLCTAFVTNSDLMNGVVTGKYFWFYLSMALLVPITVICYIINRKNIRLSFVDLLILLFYTIATIVTYTISGTIGSKMILFTLITILYFSFRIFMCQNKLNFYVLTVVFILLGLVESARGLMQYSGLLSYTDTFGSSSGLSSYACFLVMTSTVAFYYFLRDGLVYEINYDKRLLPFYFRLAISFLTLLLTLLVLPATVSRSAWLAMVGGCSMVSVLFYFQKGYGRRHVLNYLKTYRRKILLVSSLMLVICTTGFVAIYSQKEESGNARDLVWKISIRAISDNKLGVGIGSFAGSYGKEQTKYFKYGLGSESDKHVAENPNHASNEYLQMGVELGVIPLILFLSFVSIAIYQGIKGRKIGAVGGLVALLIFSFISYPLHILTFLIAFVFLISVCVSRSYDSAAADSLRGYFTLGNHRHVLFNRLIIGNLSVVILVITFVCLYDRSPTYQAYKDWKTAKMLYDTHACRRANVIYGRLYDSLNDHPDFLFEYGSCLSQLGEYEKSNDILKQATVVSGDPMLYNIIGKNYKNMEMYEEAIENFEISSNLAPNRTDSNDLLTKIKMYFIMKDSVRAKKTIDTSLMKNSGFTSPVVSIIKLEKNEYSAMK